MTDWVSAGAMLAAGLIVGVMFLYGMKRRQAKPDTVRADLEAKRDALVARLREDPSDKRLELEVADVLKRLDRVAAPSPAAHAAEGRGAPQKNNDVIRGFAWGAGSVAVLAGIGFFVMQQARPKETTAAMPQQASPAANDPAIVQMQSSVAQNPDNLNL